MPIKAIAITTKSGPATRYQVEYVDQNNERHRHRFKTKKAAEAFNIKVGGEVERGTHVAASATTTVAEAAKLWQATGQNDGLERTSLDQRQNHLDYHIVPLIGGLKLTQLTGPRVRKFKDDLIATPYPADFIKPVFRGQTRTAKTVSNVMVSLGSLLADAHERGLIGHNPVRAGSARRRRGSLAARHKKKLMIGVDIPLPAEIRSILTALRENRWRPLIMTAIFSGLRASELRGLRWRDVDLVAGTITVRQRADKFNVIGSVKSKAARRTVPLSPALLQALKEWRLVCPRPFADKTKTVREPASPDHLVFPNGDGKVEGHANLINRVLIPLMIEAGVTVDTGKRDEEGKPMLAAKYTGLHALRHFYASLCINAREAGGYALTPKEVQVRMGHESITTTLDTYGHLFPRGNEADAMAAAESALLG